MRQIYTNSELILISIYRISHNLYQFYQSMGSQKTDNAQQDKNLVHKQSQQSKSHIYACFEQPQTIDIVKYLTMPTPQKLYFDSGCKDPNNNLSNNGSSDKRSKEFKFQRIYNRQEKFKYAFSEEISEIIHKLFQGHSQSVFIYGTEQAKKDKILIGESQNAGLLLTTLTEMFDYCHDRQIQDEVTIKLSCSMFKDGHFTDPFNCSDVIHRAQNQNQKHTNQENKRFQAEQFKSIVCQDMIQNKYLLGCPQIIIRNMRTALKIINIICKKIQERRQMKEENTQNLIFTIKLELDLLQDKHTGEVYQYSIPKLHIVKLANPSVDNTLNGVNKNNEWFINLFNFLQNQVLEKSKKTANQINLLQGLKPLNEIFSPQVGNDLMATNRKKGGFTDYIQKVVLNGISDIHCFTSINNKMTSNECLTAFIFNNYLKAYHTVPKKTILNIHHYKNEKMIYQEQLMNIFTLRGAEDKRQKQIVASYKVDLPQDSHINGHNVSYFQNHNNSHPSQSSNSGKPSNTPNNYNHKGRKNQHKELNKKQNFRKSIYSEQLSSIRSFKDLLKQQDEQSTDEIKLWLFSYMDSLNNFMDCCNIVEYEYANVLSVGCQKLSKYIFNEQIQQFYYAKKISLQFSSELKQALDNLKAIKHKIDKIQERIVKKEVFAIKKTTEELDFLKNINGRQQHEHLFKAKKQKIITLNRQKELLQSIFLMYKTMAYHYIYQSNDKLYTYLNQVKTSLQRELNIRHKLMTNVDYEQIMKNIKKGFNKRIEQKKFQQQNKDQSNIVSKRVQSQTNNYSQQPSKWLNQSLINTNTVDNSIIYENADPLKALSQYQNKQKNNNDQTVAKAANHKSASIQKGKAYKTRKKVDQLDGMFTNSNVGVVRPQFNRKMQK